MREELKGIFEKYQKELEKSLDWFLKEIKGIRGGRVTPDLLSQVKIECYGSEVFLKEVARVSNEGPRTLVIQPWDKNLLLPIEKKLQMLSLGASVKLEGEKIYLNFGSLTQEDRENILKVVKEKLEGARRGLRSARDNTWQKAQNLFKEKIISENEKFQAKKEIEKLFQDFSKKLEEAYQKKEKEIILE
jgi:ribosome recycling factor